MSDRTSKSSFDGRKQSSRVSHLFSAHLDPRQALLRQGPAVATVRVEPAVPLLELLRLGVADARAGLADPSAAERVRARPPGLSGIRNATDEEEKGRFCAALF